MQAVIIGGGIVGLSSALYLRQSGWNVTVIDKGDLSNNCSFGNAGYICPSHFVPLASPGIIKQGLKWMLNSKSPFFIQPRLNWDLINWGYHFYKSATPEKVSAAAVPLRDIGILSQQCFVNWKSLPGIEMAYEHVGLMEYFQTAEKEDYANHICEKATKLGLDTKMLTGQEVQALEPHTRVDVKGALHFKCDAHLYPNKLMQSLVNHLKSIGVQFRPNETVIGFEKENAIVKAVKTEKNIYKGDAIILASGSWSQGLAHSLGLKLPIMPGRGYSITLEDSLFRLNHPAVLMESRVAITPMDGNKIRFGGTMEITDTNQPPRMNRVKGIVDAVHKYLPEFIISVPPVENIWYGFRPCSADGLPFIGRSSRYKNLILATGHSMIGMSLGAGTGKIVSEIANELQPSIDLNPFSPERFN